MQPKKDVIYIDIEDDITAIIGKVKAAGSKVVALVPPKRTGVLQSAVNLKLLQKSALEGSKRVVLITSDRSLMALAAGIKLPVAKNLQSKPEIPPVAEPVADESDVINGAELPVGELAKTVEGDKAAVPEPSELDGLNIVDKTAEAAKTPTAAKKPGSSFANKIKIPNFNSFRKKLFLIGGGAVLLIGFLVWALVIAPSAAITINARTSAVTIDRTLALVPELDASKPSELQLKPVSQQIKKSDSVEFDATGKKEVGEKATGTITIRNCDYSEDFTLPSGTQFTSGGLTFVSKAAVTVPEFSGSASSCSLSGSSSGKATVDVEANDIGTEYNVAAKSYNIQGVTGEVDAVGSAMAGGTKEQVTVVSQQDVDNAKSKLAQQDINAAKEDLRQKFGSDFVVIDESFQAEAGSPSVSPAVDQQAQKAKVTIETTYTLFGLQRSEVKQMLGDALKDALDSQPNQSVFSSGENDIRFENFQKLSNNTFSTRMVTTGYIGTTIDTNQLADELKGKRYGEIEQIVNELPGVSKVDISFSPFWVTSAPNNTDKITIRFTVVNEP
jgi:hypothetical protein